jgi:hypothetical protein
VLASEQIEKHYICSITAGEAPARESLGEREVWAEFVGQWASPGNLPSMLWSDAPVVEHWGKLSLTLGTKSIAFAEFLPHCMIFSPVPQMSCRGNTVVP